MYNYKKIKKRTDEKKKKKKRNVIMSSCKSKKNVLFDKTTKTVSHSKIIDEIVICTSFQYREKFENIFSI